MVIPSPHRECGPIEAAQRAARMNVRERILAAAPPPPKPVLKLVPKLVAPVTPATLPLWSTEKVSFDWHVMLYRATFDPKTYAMVSAIEMGTTLADLRGPARTKIMVSARAKISYELKSKFEVSFAWIGKLFRRDHSSIISCVLGYCGANGLPVLSTRHEAVSDHNMAMIKIGVRDGLGLQRMCKRYEASFRLVRSIAIREGWYITRSETNSKFDIDAIERDHAAGFTHRSIMERHGISQRHLRFVLSKIRERGQAQ